MEEKSLSQQVQEFVAALLQYLKQQGHELVSHVLVQPLQQVARQVVTLLLLATLVGLAVIFLGIGAVMGLADALGGNYALAFVAVGLALLLICAVVHLARRQPKAKGEASDEPARQ